MNVYILDGPKSDRIGFFIRLRPLEYSIDSRIIVHVYVQLGLESDLAFC